MFGLGLGLAILIDVLIVRMVIAPAVVTLLGDRAWWLPAWLDRVLPNVSLEGRSEAAGADDAERDDEPLREPVSALTDGVELADTRRRAGAHRRSPAVVIPPVSAAEGAGRRTRLVADIRGSPDGPPCDARCAWHPWRT